MRIIAVAKDKFDPNQTSWLWTKAVGMGPMPYEMRTLKALGDIFLTDAHFCTGIVYRNNTPVRRQPRIGKADLEELRSHGLQVFHTLLCADVDTCGHVDITEAELVEVREKLKDSPYGWYSTKKGIRVLQDLSKPVTGEHWEQMLPDWQCEIQKALGNVLLVDTAVKDWTRLFRLPLVMRDGHQTKSEIHSL